jgi:hypothetical protein
VTGSAIQYNYVFSPNSSFVIPKGGVLQVTLKGDATPWATGLLDATTHTFIVTTSGLTAQGALSGGGTVSPTGNATGTAQTTLRNVLVFSSTPVGLTSNRGKSVNDEVADLTFTPANGGSLYLNNATVTFAGTAASSSLFLGGVKLLDPSGNVVAASISSAACNGTNTCAVSFNFANRLVNGAQTYKLTVNDSDEATALSNSSVSLYVTVNANTDVTYTDASDGTGSVTTLPTIMQPGNQIFPINLNSVTYSQNT